MTEQYTPSDYDIHVQNPRIDQLESLITAEYQPPAGAQYSYPVASQGITQDQWQQMMLSTGDGAIVTEDSEHFFRLVKHDTDAETNQRNTLIMKVAQNTGRNEASLAGFYFRQTEDIELPFPPVTSTTTYHVTVTYDPRKFKTEPLRLEVWAGEPPRAHGQRHLVLRTVRREPNQLLSQAPISTLRHYVSPVITAVTEEGLPDSKDVLYGTLGIVRSRTSGGSVVPGTGSIFEARGIHGWHNLLETGWINLSPQNDWQIGLGTPAPQPRAKSVQGIVHLQGRVRNGSSSRSMLVLPPHLRPSRNMYVTAAVNPVTLQRNFVVETSGAIRSAETPVNYDWVSFDGITFPLD